MGIRSTVVDSVTMLVAVMGVPLIWMLFLGVVGYCCLEWLHDTLASRLAVPIRPMRTVKANP
jgi:hypothetical protein